MDSPSIPYDEILVGAQVEMVKEMKVEEIDSFSYLIGDEDSFHINDKSAEKMFFKRRICHGVHLLAFVSVLIGKRLPGFGTIYCSQSLNFTKPIFVGEVITVQVKVLGKLPKYRLRMKTTIYNENGEVAMDGEAVVKTLY